MNTFFSDPITLVVSVCVLNMLLVIGMICLLYRCKNLERSNLIMRTEVEGLQIYNDKLEDEIDKWHNKYLIACERKEEKDNGEKDFLGKITNNPFLTFEEYRNKKFNFTISFDAVEVKD